jgi:predicted secreted hydrolase
MIFHIRRKNGDTEKTFGTLVDADGATHGLQDADIKIDSKAKWKSPHSGAAYPCDWIVEIPDRGIKLHVTPAFHDQELADGTSIGIVYWEGAVKIEGTQGNQEVRGKGYVELTGYAKALGGLL